MKSATQLRTFVRSHGRSYSDAFSLAVTELFSRPEGRFPALDGVRAIAALMIVCFHCVAAVKLVTPGVFEHTAVGPVQRLLAQWWVGVDIFFVLSGFLIGRILLIQLAKEGTIHLTSFYIRRAFRIFPAYYLVLTLSTFLFARFQAFGPLYRFTTWETLLRRSPADYLYLTNYVFGGRVPHAMDWNWSLCIEEHFYLVLPATLLFLFRWIAPRWRVAVLVALTLTPMIIRSIAFASSPQQMALSVWFESHTHADGLLLGVLIAYCHVYERERFSRCIVGLGPLPGIVGAACIALVIWAGGAGRVGVFAIVLQFFVLAVGTGLFIADALYTRNTLARVLARPVWSPFAKVSYSLYLVHLFPIFMLRAIWPGAQEAGLTSVPYLLMFIAAAVSLSLVVATLLYLGVERGMMQRGAHLSRQYQFSTRYPAQNGNLGAEVPGEDKKPCFSAGGAG